MKKLNELTLEEKIGQLLVCGFHGYELNDEVRELVKKYKIGNFILFARNIKDKEQLVELTRSIHELVITEVGVMPFIAIDQEGGMVTRVMDIETTYPGQMTLGATNPKNSEAVGKLMGRHLMSLGINYNLAPDVDINNNPLNPVIGVRSYGDNPEKVSERAIKCISGMQKEGLIACAKHFPGHGDVTVDSHLGLPTLTFGKERLEKIELYPFKKVIEKGVRSIMSAHIIFTEYDKIDPATLSKPIISGLLREKLHFNGLIISDDMEMKAIDDKYTAPFGALKGLMAGLDLACLCHTHSKQMEAARLIKKAVDDGLFKEEEIDKKVERILLEKERTFVVLNEVFLENPDPLKVIKKTNIKTCQEIVDQSLTKVSGKDFERVGKALVIYSNPVASTIAEDVLNIASLEDLIKEKGIDADTIVFEKDKYDKEIVNKALEYDTVVFISFNAFTNHSQAKMINEINDNHSNFYILSIRNPYDFYALNSDANFYTLYEATILANNTIANFLSGVLTPEGALPVNLGHHFNVGASIYIDQDEYTLKGNIEYLEMLKSEGIDTVFISASHVGKNPVYLDNLKKVIDASNKIGVNLVMDINKHVMNDYDIPTNVYAMRIDYGYNAKEMADFIKEGHKIELNASAMELETLEELVRLGVDLSKIRISHNFYPKPYTGLSQETIKEKNDFFKQFGLKILAFIPSNNQKRSPIYEGLCTVEEHRHMALDAVLSELVMLGVDDVCFGDAYASAEEIKAVKNFDKDVVHIPLKLAKGVAGDVIEKLKEVHINRYDVSPYIYRTEERMGTKVTPHNTVERIKKSVTIDNELFDLYNGEVNISRRDLPKDDRVNVVGYALISDWLLDNLAPGAKFTFEIVEEEK